MKRILMLIDQDGKDFISGDLAGLSMRIWHLAKIFQQAGNVTIGLSEKGEKWEKDGINGIPINRKFNWDDLCLNYDVIYVLQSSKFESIGYKFAIRKFPIFTVVDCYTPLIFEKLAYADLSHNPQLRILEAEAVTGEILKQGDLFLCASRPQSDYLLGVLTCLGVGWSPAIVCLRTMEKIKEARSGKLQSRVVWFGGVYPWMDIEPVLIAMKSVILEIPKVELTIVGAQFKSKLGFENKWESIREKIQANLEGRVEIIDWVPLTEVSATLQGCSLAVSWAKHTFEDRLAYRSRIISVLKRGIPVMTNGKDELSELIGFFGAGVKIDRPDQLGAEISKLLRSPERLRKMSVKTSLLIEYLEDQNKSEEVRLMDFIQHPFPVQLKRISWLNKSRLLIRKMINKS